MIQEGCTVEFTHGDSTDAELDVFLLVRSLLVGSRVNSRYELCWAGGKVFLAYKTRISMELPKSHYSLQEWLKPCVHAHPWFLSSSTLPIHRALIFREVISLDGKGNNQQFQVCMSLSDLILEEWYSRVPFSTNSCKSTGKGSRTDFYSTLIPKLVWEPLLRCS